jgi:hypothetical protein
MNKAYLEELEKLSGARTDEVLRALRDVLTTKPSREHLSGWSRHAALNAGVASDDVAQGRGKDAAKAAIFAALPPTHHSKDEMRQLLRAGHRDWFRYGKGGPLPPSLKKMAAAEKPKKLPPMQEFSPRYFGGLATLGAALYGAHKLGKLVKVPAPLQKEAAARRPHGANPILNLRGRERFRAEGRSLTDLLRAQYEARPRRLMGTFVQDKLRRG